MCVVLKCCETPICDQKRQAQPPARMGPPTSASVLQPADVPQLDVASTNQSSLPLRLSALASPSPAPQFQENVALHTLAGMMLPPLVSTLAFILLSVAVCQLRKLMDRVDESSCCHSALVAFLQRPNHSLTEAKVGNQPGRALAATGATSAVCDGKTGGHASLGLAPSDGAATSAEAEAPTAAAAAAAAASTPAAVSTVDGRHQHGARHFLGLTQQTWRDTRDMVICASGVIGIFLVYGVYQEQVMTRVYYNEQHPNGEKFPSTSFLTFVNRIFTVVFALALIGGARSVEQLQPRTRDVGQYAARASLWEYAVGGYSNTISSVSQYASIHFISFPVLVLSKACKMPPVMIANWVFFGKTYEHPCARGLCNSSLTPALPTPCV